MWPALLASIGSLLGVIVGGAITYLTNRQALERQDARDRRESLLRRMDKIYEALIELEESERALQGELLSRFGINKPVEIANLKKNPIERSKFLVSAFLPGGRPYVAEIESELERFGKLFGVAADPALGEEIRKKSMQETLKIGHQFDDSISKLREKLYAAARETQYS